MMTGVAKDAKKVCGLEEFRPGDISWDIDAFNVDENSVEGRPETPALS